MLQDRVKKIMADVFRVSPCAIPDDSSAITISSWNSLNHITLILVIEEEFGVEFDEQEIAEVTSLQRIVNTLQSKAKRNERDD